MTEQEELALNLKLKRLEGQRRMLRNAAILFTAILLLVVLWNMFSPTNLIDLNKEGGWLILLSILSILMQQRVHSQLQRAKLKKHESHNK